APSELECQIPEPGFPAEAACRSSTAAVPFPVGKELAFSPTPGRHSKTAELDLGKVSFFTDSWLLATSQFVRPATPPASTRNSLIFNQSDTIASPVSLDSHRIRVV